MAFLNLAGRKIPIPAGETILGSDPANAVVVLGKGVLPQHAILTAAPDGQTSIRKSSAEAVVLVNGIRLGDQPAPLLHGDKLEVGGQELTYEDERRTGSTVYLDQINIPAAAAAAVAAAKVLDQPNAPSRATGGRVVCLTDGREYAVVSGGITFGREAGNDVVVPGSDVSRKHAEILPDAKGYVLIDHSTNGTVVNDNAITGRHQLSRGDLIKIGDDEFRFHADVAQPPPPPAVSPRPAAPAPPAVSAPLVAPAARPAPASVPQAPPQPPQPAILASFVVRSGSYKGTRYEVRMPIANIGRAEYNDMIIKDPSVSSQHAKLQFREGLWILSDLDSTNGTLVDGEPLKGETVLSPGCTVRFGDVSTIFEPQDDDLDMNARPSTTIMPRVDLPPGHVP